MNENNKKRIFGIRGIPQSLIGSESFKFTFAGEWSDIFPVRIGKKQAKAVLFKNGRILELCKSKKDAAKLCLLLNSIYLTAVENLETTHEVYVYSEDVLAYNKERHIPNCSHYFALTEKGYKPCEFCGTNHPTNPIQ